MQSADIAPTPRGPTVPTFRLGHRPELDGLRGLAVIMVVTYHLDTIWPDLGDAVLPAGYLGVDLFLVLSGFLITVLLLGERDATARIDLRSFLRRRALRLVPALVAILAVVTVVAVADTWLLGRSIYDTGETVSASAWVLTFTGNWAIVLDAGLGPFGHLWTIALEGQFYLIWALALAVVGRRSGAVLGVALAGVAAVVAWRWHAYVDRPDEVFSHYVSTLTRLDAPLAGAVAGVCVARGWARGVRGRAADVCLVVGLGAVVAAAALAGPFEPRLFRGGFTVVALAAAAAVVGAVQGGAGTSRCLSARPLVAAGRGSYSMYLWHLPVFVLVGREARALDLPLRCLVGVAFATGLAWLSYRYVEQPFLARKARRRPATTVSSQGG